MPALKPWNDLLAEMDARGWSNEQKQQKRQQYLNAWLETPEARAPKYQGLDVPPKVAKKIEMEGGDLARGRAISDELAADEETQRRESEDSTLQRGWKGLSEGVKSSAGGFLTQQALRGISTVDPTGLSELAAQSMEPDPHYRPTGLVEHAGHMAGGLYDPALAIPGVGLGVKFGAAGVEQSLIDSYRKGESPDLWDVAKRGGMGFATGKAAEVVSPVAEELASKGLARDVTTEYLPKKAAGPVKPTTGAAGTVRKIAKIAAPVAAEAEVLTAGQVAEQAATQGRMPTREEIGDIGLQNLAFASGARGAHAFGERRAARLMSQRDQAVNAETPLDLGTGQGAPKPEGQGEFGFMGAKDTEKPPTQRDQRLNRSEDGRPAAVRTVTGNPVLTEAEMEGVLGSSIQDGLERGAIKPQGEGYVLRDPGIEPGTARGLYRRGQLRTFQQRQEQARNVAGGRQPLADEGGIPAATLGRVYGDNPVLSSRQAFVVTGMLPGDAVAKGVIKQVPEGYQLVTPEPRTPGNAIAVMAQESEYQNRLKKARDVIANSQVVAREPTEVGPAIQGGPLTTEQDVLARARAGQQPAAGIAIPGPLRPQIEGWGPSAEAQAREGPPTGGPGPVRDISPDIEPKPWEETNAPAPGRGGVGDQANTPAGPDQLGPSREPGEGTRLAGEDTPPQQPDSRLQPDAKPDTPERASEQGDTALPAARSQMPPDPADTPPETEQRIQNVANEAEKRAGAARGRERDRLLDEAEDARRALRTIQRAREQRVFQQQLEARKVVEEQLAQQAETAATGAAATQPPAEQPPEAAPPAPEPGAAPPPAGGEGGGVPPAPAAPPGAPPEPAAPAAPAAAAAPPTETPEQQALRRARGVPAPRGPAPEAPAPEAPVPAAAPPPAEAPPPAAPVTPETAAPPAAPVTREAAAPAEPEPGSREGLALQEQRGNEAAIRAKAAEEPSLEEQLRRSLEETERTKAELAERPPAPPPRPERPAEEVTTLREALKTQARDDPEAFGLRYVSALRGTPGAEGATPDDFKAIQPSLAGGRRTGKLNESLKRMKAIGEADYMIEKARRSGDWNPVQETLVKLEDMADAKGLNPDQSRFQDYLEMLYEHEARIGKKPAEENIFEVPPEIPTAPAPEEQPALPKPKKDGSITLGTGLGAFQPMYEALRDRFQGRRPSRAEVRDAIHAYYITNLLSSPKTHFRNILSNGIHLAMTPLTTPASALMDRLNPAAAERQVLLGELPKQIKGTLAGFPDAFNQAWQVFVHGGAPGYEGLPDVREMKEYPVLKTVTRALSAADRFGEVLAFNMDKYANAYRTAYNELAGSRSRGMSAGERRAAVLDRAAELIVNPTPQLLAESEAFARRRVFHEQSWLSEWLKEGRAKGGLPAKILLPFVETPLAILRQGLRFSPAGFKKGIRGELTPRLDAQAMGEALTGSIAMVGWAYMAMNGQLSGSGPKSAADRDKLEREGWKPYSINVAGHWINYEAFQPAALGMAMTADAVEAWKDHLKKDPDAKTDPGTYFNMAFRAGQVLLRQGTIKSVSDLFRATTDEGWGQRMASSYVSGFIPGSALLRAVRQYQDPTIRQPKTFAESIESQLPNVTLPGGRQIGSKQIPPQLRATGEERTMLGGPFQRAFSPVDIAEAKPPTETQRKLDELGITLPMLRGGKPTSPTRMQDVVDRAARGKATMDALDRLFSRASFDRPPADEREKQRRVKQVKDTIEGARREVATKQKRTKMIEQQRQERAAGAGR